MADWLWKARETKWFLKPRSLVVSLPEIRKSGGEHGIRGNDLGCKCIVLEESEKSGKDGPNMPICSPEEKPGLKTEM